MNELLPKIIIHMKMSKECRKYFFSLSKTKKLTNFLRTKNLLETSSLMKFKFVIKFDPYKSFLQGNLHLPFFINSLVSSNVAAILRNQLAHGISNKFVRRTWPRRGKRRQSRGGRGASPRFIRNPTMRGEWR